jgi:hypothetical protein
MAQKDTAARLSASTRRAKSIKDVGDRICCAALVAAAAAAAWTLVWLVSALPAPR